MIYKNILVTVENPTFNINNTNAAVATVIKSFCALLQNNEYIYYRADLNIGDCIVMDSRTFHYGSSNTSCNQRTLLYFTIRNPLHDGDYPDCGSLFEDLNLTTDDIKELVTA